MSWTYCMHNHCFRCYMLCNALLHTINVKFGPLSENYLSPWYPKLVTGLLVTVALWLLSVMPLISVFLQSNFSGLTSKFNRRNQGYLERFSRKLFSKISRKRVSLGEINVKSFILELYMHNDTKTYLGLNWNQNEQPWTGK